MLYIACNFFCVSASVKVLFSFVHENFLVCFKIGLFWQNNLCLYFNSPFLCLNWQMVLLGVLQTWSLSFVFNTLNIWILGVDADRG